MSNLLFWRNKLIWCSGAMQAGHSMIETEQDFSFPITNFKNA
jgi:hypothetical protein